MVQFFRFFLFCILLFLQTSAKAQKTDYQWALGGFNPTCNTCLYRFFYNFKTDPPSIVLRNDTISTPHFMATYSDRQGNILFFSDGLRIYDKQSRLVENGFGLSPTFAEFQTYRGYPFFQSGFFLENPGDSNLLYLIHLDMDMYPANTLRFIGKNLMVTTIDRSANNGAGKVIAKNEVLLTGFLQNAAATRHANGRDWWILVPEAGKNIYHRFLLTPNGFSDPWKQDIGSKPGIPNSSFPWLIGSKFSQSGKQYIDMLIEDGFSLYDFDRCTGLLSREQRFNNQDTPQRYVDGGGGVEITPDDRFLYVTATHAYWLHFPLGPVLVPYLIQYDLKNPDWASKGDTMNYVPPGPYDLLNTNLYEFFLGSSYGPDGRIYVTYLGGSYCTVQYPNRKGKAAGFKYDSPDFKNNIYRGIPYLPNYRLGPLDGSTCDTLSLNNVPVANFRMDTPDSSDLLTRFFYDLSHHEPATWQWDFGDGSTSTDTSATHAYTQAGRYRVCLTVKNPYGSDTYCREVSVGLTKTDEVDKTAEILLFLPNPAQTGTTLYLPSPEGLEGATLHVVDALGRPMLRMALRGQLTELALQNWPPGVYFAKVERRGMEILGGKLVVGN